MGWKAAAWAHGPIMAGAQLEALNTYLRAPADSWTPAPDLGPLLESGKFHKARASSFLDNDIYTEWSCVD